MNHKYNNKKYKNLRKKLRKNLTPSERLLWSKIRNKQFLGYKFYRQYGVLNYIVDFYCPIIRLCIEIDGLSHDTKYNYDKVRQKTIENLDIKVLRFSEFEVRANLDEVLQTIENCCNGVY